MSNPSAPEGTRPPLHLVGHEPASPQPNPEPEPQAVPVDDDRDASALPVTLRLADGRTYNGKIPAERHSTLHIGALHQQSHGWVELASGPRVGGKWRIDTRTHRDSYFPAGRDGGEDWIAPIMQRRAQWLANGRDIAIGVTARDDRRGTKQVVSESRWLWVDVDGPEGLPALWQLCDRFTPHLVLFSGGSGGAHAYWRLAHRIPATNTNHDTGEVVDVIERANNRLIYALGHALDEHGNDQPTVADPACKDRSRLMRLAGTINAKTGRYARLVFADFQLPGYKLGDLVGDLPDPQHSKPKARSHAPRINTPDPYRGISAREYFDRIAGIDVPSRGLVSCPHTDHADRNPSCKVSEQETWYCHGCGRGGGIYDLASAVLGGPTGSGQLTGDAFKAAKNLVIERLGER